MVPSASKDQQNPCLSSVTVADKYLFSCNTKIVFTNFTFKLIHNVSSRSIFALCACMLCMNVHMHVYVVHALGGGSGNTCHSVLVDVLGTFWCLPFPPCLRKDLCLHKQLSGPPNSRASRLCPPPLPAVGTQNLQMSATVPSFYVGSWGSNSGSHSCPV